MKKQLAVLAVLLLLFGPIAGVSASTSSNTVAVPVTLAIPESVSLTTSSNSIILNNTTTAQTITLTASWQIASGHTTAPHIYSWFSALPSAGNLGSIGGLHFSTSYDGGTAVNCAQPTFVLPGGSSAPFGSGGQNCGVFTFSQNVASDLNDSVAVQFTLAADPGTFQVTPGTYSGGVLNLLFEIL
jgi:hypothetical protein